MSNIQKLLDIMDALRDPDDGCPWDLAQSFETIAPFTIEEAYEVADAIARGEPDELCDELGDLLFQVVFHAALARDAGWFDFDAVCEAISGKLVRRHPHVFAGAAAADETEAEQRWEAMKAAERSRRRAAGALDGIPAALPALSRALKLGRRASRVGFDWQDTAGVRAKLDEELAELDSAAAADDPAALADECGDLLFTLASYCRKHGIDPEEALRHANRKFERRFRAMERASAASLETLEAAELDVLWEAAKVDTAGP